MRGRHRIHPTSSSRGLPSSSRRAPTAGSSRVSIVRPSAHRLPGSYRRQLQRASRDKRNAQASGLKRRLRRSRRRSGWGERQFDVLGRAYNKQSQAPQPGKSRLRRHSALEQRRISSKVKVPGVSSAMLRRVMSESSLTSRHTKGLPATMEEAPVRAIATTSGAEQSHAAAFRESLTQRPAWTGRRRSVASPGPAGWRPV